MLNYTSIQQVNIHNTSDKLHMDTHNKMATNEKSNAELQVTGRSATRWTVP